MKTTLQSSLFLCIFSFFLQNVTKAQIIASSSECPNLNSIYIIGENSVCNNDSLILKVSDIANVTYLWSNGKTTESIVVKNAATYSVTVTCLTDINLKSIQSITVNSCCPDATGGKISGAEDKCGTYQPTTIASDTPSSGGAGELTYFWIKTTSLADVLNGTQTATMKIPNTNTLTYTPSPISVTTWYRRCSYRAGCYNNGLGTLAESNWIKKCVSTSTTLYIDKTGQPCGDTYTALTANGKPAGGKYLWSSGDTTAFLPIKNSTLNGPTTYSVTYTLPGSTCGQTGSVVVDAPTCFPITNGGNISEGKVICNATSYDPPKIVSIGRPQGGGGEITYFWIYTTKNPEDSTSGYSAGIDNVLIPNSNMDCYDPPVITKTTWFRRCGLGKGCCSADPGESNWVKFELKANCCDQVTDPGEIGENEERCFTEYKPNKIVSKRDASGGSGTLEYVWLNTSLYDADGDPRNFQMISGATDASYDPPVIAKTTWFRRCARRAGCEGYQEVVWIKKEVVVNVKDPGEICCPETSCKPSFIPKPLKNVRLASGGSGQVEYIWIKSDEINPAGSPVYAEILGAIDTVYAPNEIAKTTNYRRCARTVSKALPQYQCPFKETTPMPKVIKSPVTLENVPANMTLSCETPYSITAVPTLKGNMMPTPISLVEAMKPGGCPDSYVIKRTWTTTDNCGSTVTACQFITKVDNTKPVFTSTVKDITVTCGTNISLPTQLANDNCDKLVQIDVNQKLVPSTLTEPTKIIRTWTANDNCSNTAQLTQIVTIVNNPNFKAIANTPLCTNSNLNLNTSGCNTCSYAWTGPNGFTSSAKNPVLTSANPSLSGVYSVKMTDPSGCNSTVPVSVVVNPNPVATITVNSPLCAGASLNFCASNATSYIWTGPVLSSNVQKPVITNVNSSCNGVYKLTVTDQNGCKGSTSTKVVVNTAPDFVIIAANGNTICAGKTISLGINQTIPNTVWTGPLAYTFTGKTMTRTNATTAMSGDYKVVVTSPTNGCSQTKTANIVVNSCVAGLAMQNKDIELQNELLALESSTESSAFAIFPNPVDQRLNVVLSTQNLEHTDLNIYDQTGKQVYRKNIQTIDYEGVMILDLEDLPSGFYIITFGKERKKFVKQ
jgi:hypothetical protein